MGINLPQLAPASTDRVSGASVIDGSLKFGASSNASGPFLSKTPGSAGDRKTWTLSCWIKRNQISFSPDQRIFTARAGDGSGTQAFLKFTSADVIQYVDSLNSASISTTAKFRDTGWYHLTVVLDAAKTGLTIYINGEEQILTGTQPSDTDGNINNNILHAISYDYFSGGTGEHTDTLMSQFYLIDGIALGPEYFGYTDPLTNTWRPKKHSIRDSLNVAISDWSSYFTTSASWTNASYLFDGAFGSGGETQVRDGANNNPALDVSIPVSSPPSPLNPTDELTFASNTN